MPGIRELKKEASALGIVGYGSMAKGVLMDAIEKKKGALGAEAAAWDSGEKKPTDPGWVDVDPGTGEPLEAADEPTDVTDLPTDAVPTKTCPKCGKEGPIVEDFGYRKVGEKVYPQSQCRTCRSKKKPKAKQQ